MEAGSTARSRPGPDPSSGIRTVPPGLSPAAPRRRRSSTAGAGAEAGTVRSKVSVPAGSAAQSARTVAMAGVMRPFLAERVGGLVAQGVGPVEDAAPGAVQRGAQRAVPVSLGAAGDEFGEQALVALGDPCRVEAVRGAQRGPAHPVAQAVVLDQLEQRGGDRVRVADRHQPPVDAVLDDLGRSVRAVGGDDRQAAAHRLDDRHAEGLAVRSDGGDRPLGPLGLHRVGRAHQEHVVVQVELVDQGAQRRLFVAGRVPAAVDAQPPVGTGRGHLGEGSHQEVVALDPVQPACRDDPLQVTARGRTGGLGNGVGDGLDPHAGQLQPVTVVVRVGTGDGGERVEQRVPVGDLAAQSVVVAVERQVLLPDAHRSAAGLPAEVHVETGAGADDDIGLDRPEMGGDAGVGEPAVLLVPAVPAREHRCGPGVFGVAAVVRRALLPQVDEVAQRHALGCAEDGGVTVPEDGHDLDVVLLGESTGERERRPDGSPDSIGIVQKKRNMHGVAASPVDPALSSLCFPANFRPKYPGKSRSIRDIAHGIPVSPPDRH